jgi:hypothetical protein
VKLGSAPSSVARLGQHFELAHLRARQIGDGKCLTNRHGRRNVSRPLATKHGRHCSSPSPASRHTSDAHEQAAWPSATTCAPGLVTRSASVSRGPHNANARPVRSTTSPRSALAEDSSPSGRYRWAEAAPVSPATISGSRLTRPHQDGTAPPSLPRHMPCSPGRRHVVERVPYHTCPVPAYLASGASIFPRPSSRLMPSSC